MAPKLIVAAVIPTILALLLVLGTAHAQTHELRHFAIMLLARTVDESFIRLDTNQDGYVDSEEAAQDVDILANFGQIDTDGDGLISPREWSIHHQRFN